MPSEKEVKYMEMYTATITRTDSSATLKLALGSTSFDIVLTEDKPNDVKAVFNKLLIQLKNGVFSFTLDDKKEDLYFHICKEYINQLNSELASVYQELKDNDLLTTNDRKIP
jgi:hypothetical protein